MEQIGEVIARLRSEKGLSQKVLAAGLRADGIAVTNQAVSKWETGSTQPSAAQLLAVCRILGVTDVLSAFGMSEEGGILRGLNRRGREKALEYIELLKRSEAYCSRPNMIALRQLPLYHIAASAGTGQFLDSDDYELVEVGEDVPANANFGVRIAGDSMEPKFHDGDVVWVMQDRLLRHGEIGVFLWQGDVYCKKLDTQSGRVCLRSLNPAYSPIAVDEDADFRVFGRVVAQWNARV